MGLVRTERLAAVLVWLASVGAGSGCHGGERSRTSSSLAPVSVPVPAPTSAPTSEPGSPAPVASSSASPPSVGAFPLTSASTSASSAPEEPAFPKAVATLRLVKVVGGRVDNAARVVAGLHTTVRQCYQRGLADDRKMKGKLRLTLDLDARGRTKAIAVKAEGGSIEASVTECVVYRAKNTQFDAPKGPNWAWVELTVTFESQTAGSE